jgi:hypothetical protein
MLGVPMELAEHSLDVSKTAKPVKQKLRRFAKDRKEVIRVEVLKLLTAGFIRECKNPVWLANPVLVPKKTGQWRMCIDYTNLNRHCPQRPLPSIAHRPGRRLCRGGHPVVLPRLLLGLPLDSLEGL